MGARSRADNQGNQKRMGASQQSSSMGNRATSNFIGLSSIAVVIFALARQKKTEKPISRNPL